MTRKLTAREALANAQTYALSRNWAISKDDQQYLSELRQEVIQNGDN